MAKASLKKGTLVQVDGDLYQGRGKVVGYKGAKVRVERLEGYKAGKVLLYNGQDLKDGKLSLIRATKPKPKGLTAIQAKKQIARARRQTQQIIVKAKRDLVRALRTISKLRAKR